MREVVEIPAVLLNAAYERQARHAGISDRFEPYLGERVRRASESLDDTTRYAWSIIVSEQQSNRSFDWNKKEFVERT